MNKKNIKIGLTTLFLAAATTTSNAIEEVIIQRQRKYSSPIMPYVAVQTRLNQGYKKRYNTQPYNDHYQLRGETLDDECRRLCNQARWGNVTPEALKKCNRCQAYGDEGKANANNFPSFNN